MPVKRTPSPSILQSSSRYKAKPLCDGPLVPVLLRLAQTHQHLLVKNIKCRKIYKKLCIRTGFVKICAKKNSVKTNVSRAFYHATALKKEEEVHSTRSSFPNFSAYILTNIWFLLRTLSLTPREDTSSVHITWFCVVFRRPCCTNLGP